VDLEGTERPHFSAEFMYDWEGVVELIIEYIHAWRAAGCIEAF
jgi:hypothetical protein